MFSRSVFMVLFFAFSVQFMGCRPRQEAPNEAKLSETASAPDSAAVASPAIPQQDALVMLSTCLDESSPAANEWAGRYFADVQRHGPLCSSLAGERALLDADTISRCQSAYDAALSQALPSSLVQSAKNYIDAYAVLVPLVQKAAQLFSSAALLSKCDDALALHEQLALAFEQFRSLDEHFSLELKAAQREHNQDRIEAIEQSEGRTLEWHWRTLLLTSARLIESIPRDPETPLPIPAYLAELAKLDTAFEQWLRFCTQQPELCAAHDPRTEFERSARSFVLSARAVRDLLAEANEQDLNEQVDEVIAQHESWSSIAVQLLSELTSTDKAQP